MDRHPLDSLPDPQPSDAFQHIRRLVAATPAKVVVLDDDPTGSQTMHGVDVHAEWTVASLMGALRDPRPCFYLLTNSRSLDVLEAANLSRTIARNLAAAGRETGVPFTVVSRSDSTLRGHFAAELDALEEGLGGRIDARIVIPAFFEGGRYTIGDVHYVDEGDRLVPAADTEYARDRAFGYRSSNLRQWIEEKTLGAVPASRVESIAIETLRSPGGHEAVTGRLLAAPRGSYVIVNAAAYPDLDVFVRGLLEAEAAGRRFLLRTAASFVRVRSGVEPKPVLPPGRVFPATGRGILVVAGSYVGRTTAQLGSLLQLPGTDPVEVRVGLLAYPRTRDPEVGRAAEEATASLRAGRVAVVFTSRELESALGSAGDLPAGRVVSDALVAIVRAIPERPRCLIAKGGITSCEIAIRALGMRRSTVVGQAAPGVPVWELGPESRLPGLAFVVWPGNVGGADALRDLVRTA
jgi:uncharacterized protein YgbK (DUF1537 family)